MRMVLTQDVTNGASRFLVFGLRLQTQFRHGIDDAPLHRFKAVTDIRQGTVHDHVHRIVEIRLFGEVFQGQLLDALVIDFGRFTHQSCLSVKKQFTAKAQSS